MDNIDEVEFDDNEIVGQEDEKVVTMMDVLKEQEDFEEDANAVLGASDDKNCTYSLGYIKRQAIYACMTCNPDAKDEPAKRAGVCLACSLKCHEDHELVELYTKRNFRCDCGNPKFKSHPCQFTPHKPDLNEENSYNQNFSGLYCTCQRPYPDPDVTDEDEMIQCIICEDWLHSAHLDATVPDNDQYGEMVCKQCMVKNNFLHNYGDLIVNSEADVIDISMNGLLNSDANENINIMDTSCNNLSISNIENLPKKYTFLEQEDKDINKNDELETDTLTTEKDYKNISENIDKNKSDDLTKVSQDNIKTSSVNNVMTSDKTEIEGNTKNALSPVQDVEKEHHQATLVNDLQNENNTVTGESTIEPSQLPEMAEHKKSVANSTEGNENEAIKNLTLNVNNIDSTISSSENKNKGIESNKVECDPKIGNPHENVSDEFLTKPDMSKIDNEHNNEMKAANNKELLNVESTNDAEVEKLKQVSTKSAAELEDRLLADTVELINVSENSASQFDRATDETKIEKITTAPVTEKNIETSQEKYTANGTKPLHVKDSSSNLNSDDKITAKDNDEKELPLGSVHKNDNISCEKMDCVTDDSECSNVEISMERSEKPDCKRKLSVKDHIDDLESKKPKLDSKPCVKPQNVKQKYKGATFWPANFRQKICTCNECLSMYKDLSVLFLIDPEDTVSAYEHLGKEKSNGKPSEYEKGLAALSSLDRVQQINALTEYNKMRDKLLDFLKSFKDRKEVVKEEDIKAFFAGMKPKREPDGVYFCR